MDPLSITTSATAILAICLQTVHLIQRTIETVKNARKVLVRLLSQTERLRLILEQLRSLTKQLGGRGGLLLSYNDHSPMETINELNTLVKSIADKSNFVGIQMLLNKGKVDGLLEKLKSHEEEVMTILLSIATSSAVRTENEILQIREESKAQSEVFTLFEDYFVNTGPNGPAEFRPTRCLQIWFGDTYREGFSQEHLAMRDKLSNAAYAGDFDGIFEVLRYVEETFGECWVDAPRLSWNPGQTSGWSPLHQAAFMSAPTSVVQDLLDIGGSRTLRTNWTDKEEFSFTDMTAVEIAREHGYSHLFELLAPMIRNPVPHHTLERLQQRFHAMIRNDLSGFSNQEHLRLPELIVLTEMATPEMWFPLKSNNEYPRGYLYYLDGRSLVVKVIAIRDCTDSRLYRLYEDECKEIIEGVTFGTYTQGR